VVRAALHVGLLLASDKRARGSQQGTLHCPWAVR
jgi:hypothetical protein